MNKHPLMRAKRIREKERRWKKIFPLLLFLVVFPPPIIIFATHPHTALPSNVGSILTMLCILIAAWFFFKRNYGWWALISFVGAHYFTMLEVGPRWIEQTSQAKPLVMGFVLSEVLAFCPILLLSAALGGLALLAKSTLNEDDEDDP